MGKNNRIIHDENEKIAALSSMEILRLGLVDDEGHAYIVPVNFAYFDNKLYFHTGLKGKKISFLKRDIISFQADRYDGLKTADTACGHSSYFYSVYGKGHAEFLQSYSDKIFALNLLMEKYTGKKYSDFPSKTLDITEVVCIHIQSLEARAHTKV